MLRCTPAQSMQRNTPMLALAQVGAAETDGACGADREVKEGHKKKRSEKKWHERNGGERTRKAAIRAAAVLRPLEERLEHLLLFGKLASHRQEPRERRCPFLLGELDWSGYEYHLGSARLLSIVHAGMSSDNGNDNIIDDSDPGCIARK